MTGLDTDAVLSLVRDVADEVVVPRFRALDSEEIDEKGPGDLVTVADQEAEELLTRALLAAYPDAVVLGEEATASDPSVLDRFRAAGMDVDGADVSRARPAQDEPRRKDLGQTSRLWARAASMKLAKSGWGSKGFDFSSGWNWTPMNHG